MSDAIVPSGIYFGFTKAKLLKELDRYTNEVQKMSSRRLQSASVAGQSYTYGPTGDLSLSQWSEEIRTALAAVDPDQHTLPSSFIAASF